MTISAFVISYLINYIVVASLPGSLTNFKISTIVFIYEKKNLISLSDSN